jgi:hypothetical protein
MCVGGGGRRGQAGRGASDWRAASGRARNGRGAERGHSERRRQVGHHTRTSGRRRGLPTPGLAHARMRPRPMALLAAFPKSARPQILVRTAPETLEYDPARHGEQAMLPVHQASPSAVLAEGCSRLLELERKGGGLAIPSQPEQDFTGAQCGTPSSGREGDVGGAGGGAAD